MQGVARILRGTCNQVKSMTFAGKPAGHMNWEGWGEDWSQGRFLVVGRGVERERDYEKGCGQQESSIYK